jgi:hypothetical protein
MRLMRHHPRFALLLPLALLLGTAGTARAQEQDSPRAIMEKRGLLGTWAADCGKRAAATNYYIVYRALDERRVQRDAMIGPTQRAELAVVESVLELGTQDLQVTEVIRSDKGEEFRNVAKLHVEGNRRRTMESVINGKNMIVDGRWQSGARSGKTVDWLYRCD